VTVARLTDREARVLEKLAGGLIVQQTADALVVSYNTVKTQQRSVFHKLGVDNRADADAVARARRWGLLLALPLWFSHFAGRNLTEREGRSAPSPPVWLTSAG
jgi:DNA-binding CsgD family transcriptional regulator